MRSPRTRRLAAALASCLFVLASAHAEENADTSLNSNNNNNNNDDNNLGSAGDLDCQCVPYFLCSENNTIIDNGHGLIDVRTSIPSCSGDIEVCCRVPSSGSTSPPPQPDHPQPQPQPTPDYSQPDQPQPQPQPTPDYSQPDYPQPQPQPTPDYSQPDYPQPQPTPGGAEGYVIVPQSGCGVKRQQGQTTTRILVPQTGEFDDTATHFAEFPWMLAVLLEERVADGRLLNRFKCGASLIAPGVALTAAHCIIGQEPSALKVRAGEWDTQNRSEPLPHQDRGVTRVLLHPEYKPGPLYNDVALIFLDAPFELADNVDTVCLPEPGQVFEGRHCFATGWGRDSFGSVGAYQKILRKVELPMVPHAECQSRLRQTRLGAFFRLHSNFVCAGGEEGRDTCQGDGGGPLVCPMPQDPSRYAQVGVVAWGIGCGEAANPAVYGSVPAAVTWINSHLR